MKTSLLLDQEPLHDKTVVRALLKIEGDAPTAHNRTPLNLAIVLDRSGSMSGPKLHAARDAAALLVSRLAPDDAIHVVVYDDEVQTIPTSDIKQIHSGGMTNLSGGWLKGRDHVAHAVKPKTANRVILMTDGQANVGITDPDQLAGLCSMANEHGIKTSTIGFGEDYDEHLLRRIAEAGGGNMHYIEHADQAPAVFAEEIEGLLSLAAQNLTVTVIPAAIAQAVAVHHSYPRHETADGLLLELGDLYAREPKLVLFEFLVPTLSDEVVQIAKLVIEGAVLNADGSVAQQEIVLQLTTSTSGAVVNPEVRRELLLLEAAKVRSAVLEDRRHGRFNEAAEKLREMSLKMRAAGLDDAQIQEEAEDLMMTSETFATCKVSESDVKYLYQRSYDSSRAMRMKSDSISRSKRNRNP